MQPTNLERMIALADEFFEAKRDPDQIVVDEEVLNRLRAIHPSTIGEEANENGPIAWMLVIPVTHEVMERFIRKEISERMLLEIADARARCEALYLCSALVLPEYRRKGLAKRLAVRAVHAIGNDHPLRELCCWAFSDEGRKLAESIARECRLPLYRRDE